MALFTKQTVTGSGTNLLGTVGRSVFNSTVGTFADKDTMDNVYKTLEKLKSSIETVDKTFDYEAFNGRNKADDLYSLLAGLDIQSSSDFMNKNREFMKRLMRLNKQEKDITLDAIGVDVTGESNTVKNEYVRDYNHVKGNNYFEDYAKTIRDNQIDGDETTTLQLESNTHYNYAGLHNDLYAVTQNLYPDDEDKGTFSNKWIVENRNSLMYKTKKLFASKKINTIISRFHTNPNGIPTTLDNAKTKYGLSHGRNLLRKDAEVGYSSYYVNGYDNPYCRVWTHHHQYDRYYKTIRPFSFVDEQGNYDGRISVEDFHKWGQFSDSKDTNSVTKGGWGWKKDSNNGWKYSVLQDNGMVNITPKYINGEATNIHTKQCMFSIENLAWRGYDPYSFEQALSWEQRGPLGGRIMWFPPYGIQFSETTQTQWLNNTFLGRGEDVYTYGNTTRSGTLSFMMVVDHPSILDYVSWNKQNKNVSDTDILRFLAGCGEGEGGGNDGNGNGTGGGGLRDLATPTPLTDEYTQKHDVGDVEKPTTEQSVGPEKPAPTPKPLPDKFCFYVFYPNNYSGTYDDNYSDVQKGAGLSVKGNDGTSKVEAIPYLLAGNGAQKDPSSNYKTSDGSFAGDVELKENTNSGLGNGYEMGTGGLGKNGGKIIGTYNYINGTDKKNGKTRRRFWMNLGSKYPRSGKYADAKDKDWFYRIDGRYKLPQDVTEEKFHYYNQTFKEKNSKGVWVKDAEAYEDTHSYGLNKTITVIADMLNGQVQKKEETVAAEEGKEGTTTQVSYVSGDTKVFTLAEVACALYNKEGDQKAILKNCEDLKESDRVKELQEILFGKKEKITAEDKTREISSILGEGYASVHGYENLNQVLGENRALTAAHWFQHASGATTADTNGKQIGIQDIALETGSTQDGDWNHEPNGDSVGTAKAWRYAKVTVTFKSTAISNPINSDKTQAPEGSTEEEKKNLVQNQGGTISVENDKKEEKVIYRGVTNLEENLISGKEYPLYTDSKGKKWYKTEINGVPKYISYDYVSEQEHTPTQRYGNGHTDENRLRYDQEYHFFKVLEQTDPVVFGSLMDKLQYFDPAFHSMTPEGFNGRLTFLQQCMRQGNTVSASDGQFAKSANNLAFGRAPYCVLRLGDFYNQMIIIDNLSISYDPLVWDLNVEGAGVQPLIAHIQLSFKFVGGGDMTGPIRRLQNAMSFNYYANARLYDNRADRVERKWSDKTNGAIEHDEILEYDDLKYYKAIVEDDEEFGKVAGISSQQSAYAKGKTSKDISQFYTTKMYK